MDDLTDLEPRALWRLFVELSRIPRGSGNEAAAMAWVAEQGRAAGCEVEADAAGNLLLRKAASAGREDRAPLALQAHADMVCEKDEGTPHDFRRDPIVPFRDGDVVRARDTTLGADNGIGLAAALAVLAGGVRHGPLEVLVTVDEETGLTGAKRLRPGWLRATRLLNLDSEVDGEVTIGCAGAADTIARRPIAWAPPPDGAAAFRVRIRGLKGGHSGIDIGAGRANAIRLLAQALSALLAKHGAALGEVHGGSKRNAIPREASATVFVEPWRGAAIEEEVARLEEEWRVAFGAADPGIAAVVEPGGGDRAMDAAHAAALVNLLLAAPHGVEELSPDMRGLVQTSTNLGLVETRDGDVEVTFLTRSAVDASRRALAARIGAACALASFDHRTTNGYPGWKPAPASSLVGLVTSVHERLFDEPMAVRAVHAGLECGLIGEKYPGIEMASIGPTTWDAHTPGERVSIPSVASFWRLLVGIVEAA